MAATKLYTLQVEDANITKAKVENVTEGSVLGRVTASTGVAEEIKTWVVLNSGAVTAAASKEIDLSSYYTIYDMLEVRIYGSKPATDAVNLWIRTSNDGSTYSSGVSDYAWALQYSVNGGSAGAFDAADAQIATIQSTLAGNASNEHSNLTIKIHSPNNAALYPSIVFEHCVLNASSQPIIINGVGTRLSAGVLRGIQFLYSSGNIASATWKLIGIKN